MVLGIAILAHLKSLADGLERLAQTEKGEVGVGLLKGEDLAVLLYSRAEIENLINSLHVRFAHLGDRA